MPNAFFPFVNHIHGFIYHKTNGIVKPKNIKRRANCSECLHVHQSHKNNADVVTERGDSKWNCCNKKTQHKLFKHLVSSFQPPGSC